MEYENKFGKSTANIGGRYSAISTLSKIYQNIEPRLSYAYSFNDKLTGKISFTVANQYLHLLSVNNGGLPNNVWVPVTDDILPQNARQWSLGADYNFNDQINLTTSLYYKKMRGLIDFAASREEEYVNLADFEEQTVSGGEGEAYGLEVSLNKSAGRCTGFLSYTLSWNNRRFETINQGRSYPFTYDRRHDAAIVLRYKISDRWSLSGNFVYQSGTAVTLPVTLLPRLQAVPTPVFAGRNNGRLPAYHRADIGIQNHKKSKKGKDIYWVLTIYNLYNRQNVSSLVIDSQPVFDAQDQFLYSTYNVEQISLFSFIPALTFKYKF